MSDSLYDYYNRELVFIRRLAEQFARDYPNAAKRLLLQPNQSDDPHVERLIQSFAFLAGRIHHKLDNDFPELTEALLGILYPHYLAPIPSMAIVQFQRDPELADNPNGFLIDRHSLVNSRSIDGLTCQFRTGYPVTLWNLGVTAAQLRPYPLPAGIKAPPATASFLRLELACLGSLPLAEMSLKTLRFFLHGSGPTIAELYQLLFNHVIQLVFRPLDGDPKPAPVILQKPSELQQCLKPVGFEREEGLLTYPRQSFPGYQLLTEYFAFPSKFLFLDLGGWEQVVRAGCQRKLEVLFYFNRSRPSVEQAVEAQTFQLGCTPVVNLFRKTVEPIIQSHTRQEYLVTPDVQSRLGYEVFSIDEVTSVDASQNKITEYQPFYSFRHGGNLKTERAFWYSRRTPAFDKNDPGTEVAITLVDLDLNPKQPTEPTLVLHTTCTNRDQPIKLQVAGEDCFAELQMVAPGTRLRCLLTPTPAIRPARRKGAMWRLISHLSLHHLSLTDDTEGRLALQEMLQLYDFAEISEQQRINQNLIEGIQEVKCRPVVSWTGNEVAGGFCRGTEVTITFDEQKYIGSGLYLFGCVLERFLGLYVSVNSFTQLVARTLKKQEILKKWQPRAGEQPLL